MTPPERIKKTTRPGEKPRIRIAGVGGPGLSRGMAAFAILSLMLAIGVADYFTGFEVSFLVFYFLPVALAVTAFGWQAGVVTALASVTVWLAGDFAAGAHYANPLVPWWNATIALGTCLVLIALLARLLATQREMEERIRQRTAALTDEIAERERLEKVILEISERERRSLGHDLHDGLGQHLTGTSLTGQILVEKLQAPCGFTGPFESCPALHASCGQATPPRLHRSASTAAAGLWAGRRPFACLSKLDMCDRGSVDLRAPPEARPACDFPQIVRAFAILL